MSYWFFLSGSPVIVPDNVAAGHPNDHSQGQGQQQGEEDREGWEHHQGGEGAAATTAQEGYRSDWGIDILVILILTSSS